MNEVKKLRSDGIWGNWQENWMFIFFLMSLVLFSSIMIFNKNCMIDSWALLMIVSRGHLGGNPLLQLYHVIIAARNLTPNGDGSAPIIYFAWLTSVQGGWSGAHLYLGTYFSSSSSSGTHPLYIWGELQQCGRSCSSQILCPSDRRIQTDVGHRTTLQDNAVILKRHTNHYNCTPTF